MLGAFFLLMMTVSAEEVALRVYAESKCREVCSLTANCRYYSYSEKNSYIYGSGIYCKLKQVIGTAYEKDGWYSGSRDGYEFRENTYYSGAGVYWDNREINNNIHSGINKGLMIEIKSFENCRKICAAMSYCRNYTYCEGVCYFKRKTGWTEKSDYRCVSGDSKGKHFLKGIAYVGGRTY